MMQVSGASLSRLWPQSEHKKRSLKFCFRSCSNGRSKCTLPPFRLLCGVELMAGESPTMLSHNRNEWVHRQIRVGPPPLTSTHSPWLPSHALPFPQTWHKTRGPIVYGLQRTFGSFLDGLDPVCAAACQFCLCPTVGLCFRGLTWA